MVERMGIFGRYGVGNNFQVCCYGEKYGVCIPGWFLEVIFLGGKLHFTKQVLSRCRSESSGEGDSLLDKASSFSFHSLLCIKRKNVSSKRNAFE